MQKYKDTVRNILVGYENSLRVKGLTDILNKIDVDTSITESAVHRHYNIYFNKAVLALRNRGRLKQAEWLEQETSYILRLLYGYLKMNNSVYKVDDTLLRWFRSNESNEKLYWELNDIDSGELLSRLKTLDNMLISYKGILYTIEAYGANNSMNVPHIEIATFGSGIANELGVSFGYNFEDTNSEDEEPQRLITCVCNNTSCPRYKQSHSQIYNDGAREVICDWKDCSKCSAFKRDGVLSPQDCEDLYKALFVCLNTSKSSTNSGVVKEYEHIPRPMRTDDVIIYFGDCKDRAKEFADKFAVKECTKEDNPIVGSHASPREHERRGGVRRAYTRKDGVKVKETTFKSTTVNKGFTKTTYQFKERKK